jgi:tight adherence protein B
MAMSELIIGCLLFFIAFSLLGLHYAKKGSGIALKDEWTEIPSSNIKYVRRKNLIIGFCVSAIAAYIVTGQLIITIIAGAMGSVFVANWITDKKIQKKQDILEEQYTQVLSSILSSLQGGANPYQALEETVTGLKNPAKDVFVEIIRRNRTGSNYSEAIQRVAKETEWEDLYQLEMAFRLYDKTGSNLVEVCNHLLQTAYDRKINRKYIAATTANIRTTTIVLTILPFVVMAYMRISAPDFAYPLFNTTGGIIVLFIIIAMIIMGNKITRKMIDNLI